MTTVCVFSISFKVKCFPISQFRSSFVAILPSGSIGCSKTCVSHSALELPHMCIFPYVWCTNVIASLLICMLSFEL